MRDKIRTGSAGQDWDHPDVVQYCNFAAVSRAYGAAAAAETVKGKLSALQHLEERFSIGNKTDLNKLQYAHFLH